MPKLVNIELSYLRLTMYVSFYLLLMLRLEYFIYICNTYFRYSRLKTSLLFYFIYIFQV